MISITSTSFSYRYEIWPSDQTNEWASQYSNCYKSTSGTQRILRPKNYDANLLGDPHSPTSVLEFEEGSSVPSDEEGDEDIHAFIKTKQKARWKKSCPDQWKKFINLKKRSLGEPYEIHKKRGLRKFLKISIATSLSINIHTNLTWKIEEDCAVTTGN